jgi:hypothetical protein
MTPTKIVLHIHLNHIKLRVFAPETQTGSTVIECVPYRGGKSLPGLRKRGQEYARRFGIPFVDQTATFF